MPDIQQIQKAWGQRESDYKYLRIKWRERVTYPKGSISAQMNIMEQLSKTPRVLPAIPSEDSTFDLDGEMRLSGEKYWMSRQLMMWPQGTETPDMITDTVNWDGEKGKMFTPGSGPSNPHPFGKRKGTTHSLGFLDNTLTPIWMCARGVSNPNSDLLLDGFIVNRKVADAGRGQKLLLNKSKSVGPQLTMSTELWSSADPSYLPTRLRVTLNGRTTDFFEINYDNPRAFPTKWKQTHYSPIDQKGIALVREIEITELATNP